MRNEKQYINKKRKIKVNEPKHKIKHSAAERVIELQYSLRFMSLSNSQNYELIGMNVNN